MIDKNSPVTLSDQLVDILVNEIKTSLKPNEKMMSEREICSKYDVSRTTVRQALLELENMHYIYKRPGKGTFVATLSHDKQNLMDNYSFTDQMRQAGKIPKTIVTLFEIVNSNQYISERMQLNLGDEVYRIKRIRLADDIPLMSETSYIPVNLFKGLTKGLVKSMPLYEIFSNDYNQDIKFADEEFSASSISQKKAELLNVKQGEPCLKLRRTSYNKTNKVIELTFSTARSDQFIYKTRHVIFGTKK